MTGKTSAFNDVIQSPKDHKRVARSRSNSRGVAVAGRAHRTSGLRGGALGLAARLSVDIWMGTSGQGREHWYVCWVPPLFMKRTCSTILTC